MFDRNRVSEESAVEGFAVETRTSGDKEIADFEFVAADGGHRIDIHREGAVHLEELVVGQALEDGLHGVMHSRCEVARHQQAVVVIHLQEQDRVDIDLEQFATAP